LLSFLSTSTCSSVTAIAFGDSLRVYRCGGAIAIVATPLRGGVALACAEISRSCRKGELTNLVAVARLDCVGVNCGGGVIEFVDIAWGERVRLKGRSGLSMPFLEERKGTGAVMLRTLLLIVPPILARTDCFLHNGYRRGSGSGDERSS
jgi:hypothetical protein